MTSMDIVQLIETNPITKFSGNYQSRLVGKLRESFTETQQQTFLTNFYCYLNCNKTDFVIDLDDVWEWMGFAQKQKAKRVLVKYFVADKDYTNSLVSKDEQDSSHGGGNRQIIKLTVPAFKRFCLKAGTTKADEIHEYYIKLEEVLQETICEEGMELQNQLKALDAELTNTTESLATATAQIANDMAREKELQKEEVLLTEFTKQCSLVYVIRVKSFDNGGYIVKIGESRCGIRNRYTAHKANYPECVLLDVFLVDDSKSFEKMIHEHVDIRLNQVTDMAGHENETELFLVGRKLSYRTILNVISHNIKYFNNTDMGRYISEIETLKLQLELARSSTAPSTDDVMMARLTAVEKNQMKMMELMSASKTTETTRFNAPLQTLGPRLQKINPDTMELVHVYETVTELMRENIRMKRPSLNKAVAENTIYNGFRWNLVDRELDATVLGDIAPTKQTRNQYLGYIAKLNPEKTRILGLYIDRKTAARQNGYPSAAGLDVPVKSGKISKGSYYMLHEKCEESVRTDFANHIGGEPMLYRDGLGQFDLEKKLVREFACKYDCIRQLKISDKTLFKAMDKEIPFDGHHYQMLGSRMFYEG